MSFSSQLVGALHESWKKVEGSTHYSQGARYAGVFGGNKAVIFKRGKNFYLDWRGMEFNLGRRATFDHAEGIMKKRIREGLEEARNKGSFFDQRRIPKEGEKVWALVGQVDQKPIQGTISRVERTYHGGHYYCEVQTAKGAKRVSSDLIFDHRPKRTKRRDEFGEVTVWESSAA